MENIPETPLLPTPRVTKIEPWSKSVLEKAFQATGSEWDEIEEIATRAQGAPDFND